MEETSWRTGQQIHMTEGDTANVRFEIVSSHDLDGAAIEWVVGRDDEITRSLTLAPHTEVEGVYVADTIIEAGDIAGLSRQRQSRSLPHEARVTKAGESESLAVLTGWFTIYRSLFAQT